MPQSTCTVDGCDRPRYNKTFGYCKPHYIRMWRHGDVQAHIPVPPKRQPVRPVEDFPDGTRRCQACDKRLPLDLFHRDPSSPLGRKTSCRECRTETEKQRHAADRDRIRERMKNYRRDNQDLVHAQDMARYERNKEARIAQAVAHSHLRRARIRSQVNDKGVTVPALRERDGDNCHYCNKRMIFGRFARAERPGDMATLEHKTPISRGGSHTWGNCVLACWRCNSSKGAKTWEQYEAQQPHSSQAS